MHRLLGIALLLVACGDAYTPLNELSFDEATLESWGNGIEGFNRISQVEQSIQAGLTQLVSQTTTAPILEPIQCLYRLEAAPALALVG